MKKKEKEENKKKKREDEEAKSEKKDNTTNKSEKKTKTKEKKSTPQLPVKDRKVKDEEYKKYEQFLNKKIKRPKK